MRSKRAQLAEICDNANLKRLLTKLLHLLPLSTFCSLHDTAATQNSSKKTLQY